MKVSALTKVMNDYGTKPRVRVLQHMDGYNKLVYEGNPYNMEEEVGKLRLNSFTVLGKGFIEIHAQ